MANAGFGTDLPIDDPLAELERLVNERTKRMALDNGDRLVEAPSVGTADEFNLDTSSVLADLDALLSEPLVLPEAVAFEQSTPEAENEPQLDAMLPSLAALRGGFGGEASDNELEPALPADIEAALGDALANAVDADGSALATLAARPIDVEVPEQTFPVEVPELPAIDEATVQAQLDSDFERELVDELYLIEDPESNPAIAHAAEQTSLAANDDGDGRRRGWLIAAMLGGVAVLGGAGAMTLGGDTGVTEVALVRADPTPVKVRPAVEEKAPTQARANPVYDRVASSASAKVADEETPALVDTVEDVSNVRVARAEPTPKSIERLDASETEIDIGPTPEVASLGPRKVRTLRVGRDGKLVAPDAVDQPETAAASPSPSTPAPADAVVNLEAEETTTPVEVAALENEGELAPGIPLPRFRPAGLAQLASATIERSEPVTARTAPVQAGSSEWRVQVASVPDGDTARSVYANLSSRYASLLGGRGVDYQVAEIDGRGTFHRVRIATSSKGDADSLCAQLKRAGASCFVTR